MSTKFAGKAVDQITCDQAIRPRWWKLKHFFGFVKQNFLNQKHNLFFYVLGEWMRYLCTFQRQWTRMNWYVTRPPTVRPVARLNFRGVRKPRKWTFSRTPLVTGLATVKLFWMHFDGKQHAIFTYFNLAATYRMSDVILDDKISNNSFVRLSELFFFRYVELDVRFRSWSNFCLLFLDSCKILSVFIQPIEYLIQSLRFIDVNIHPQIGNNLQKVPERKTKG